MPHSAWDNFFSGDKIMDCLGREGFAATMNCHRDCLPSGVPGKHFHKEKMVPGDKQAYITSFHKPIIAVKFVHSAGAASTTTSVRTRPYVCA